MNAYKYRIYHDEDHCSKVDLARPVLTIEQLELEYDSIEIELHLFSREKNVSVSCEIARSQQGGVVVVIRGFNSEKDADKFIGEFPAWLKNKLGNSHFCPAATKAHV